MADRTAEISYLYAAMTSKWGVVIDTDNVKLLSARLYKTRQELGDPDLARLQLRPAPMNREAELWIVKGEVPKQKESSS